jgi:hypothetical protein
MMGLDIHSCTFVKLVKLVKLPIDRRVLVELVINDDRLNKAQTCRLKVPGRQMSLL